MSTDKSPIEPSPEETQRPVDELFPIVYDRLRGLARHFLTPSPVGHTLQPTALVHEAYMKLQREGEDRVLGRSHFLATAALAMRQILVDHARGKGRKKRGSAGQRVTLTGMAGADQETDFIALDDALEQLERLDQRKTRIVEYRFFAGMSVEEVAEVLEVSVSTVEREWRLARAWLSTELRDGQSASPAEPKSDDE